MTADSETREVPPPLGRHRAALLWGALGALAGAAGWAAGCLVLFVWDSVEDGRVEWATLREAALSVRPSLPWTVALAALLCAALGGVLRRKPFSGSRKTPSS
jgi:hypothetical protein